MVIETGDGQTKWEMKLYTCSNCNALLYFENNICLNCQHMVGFSAGKLTLITLDTNEKNQLVDISNQFKAYKFCANSAHGTCNWLIPETQVYPFCSACELIRVIQELSTLENINRWTHIEVAKHRLIYSILRLQLPLQAKNLNNTNGIAFDDFYPFVISTPVIEKLTFIHRICATARLNLQ